MSSFLFDIKPNVINLSATIRLARLISQQENQVYYTDTSDSVFTATLLKKGIGRVLYPDDFRWFQPDMALLDWLLQEKKVVYQTYGINYVFLTVRKTERRMSLSDEVPIIELPPYPYGIIPLNMECYDFFDKLEEIKKDTSKVVIIGLMENIETKNDNLYPFYRSIKQIAIDYPQYQFIILTNEGYIETDLFALPGNVAIYRYTDSQNLLSLCDMTLTQEGSYNWIKSIFAHVPTAEFVEEDIRRITPDKLEKKIANVINDHEYVMKRQQQLYHFYKQEHERLNEIAKELIDRTLKLRKQQ